VVKLITTLKRPLAILFFASLFICSCKQSEIYPNIPEIKFKEAYVIYDNTNEASEIVLAFTYKDGDGDIGLNDGDTLPPYNSDTLGDNGSSLNRFYYNVLGDYYYKSDGQFFKPIIPSTSDTIFRDVRVSNLTPEGKHKAIRGEIRITIFPVANFGDTVKIKTRLVDRALHISNEVETPELYLRKK
jgi:hypothetical protein